MLYRTLSPTIWTSPTFHYMMPQEQLTLICLLTHANLKRSGLIVIYPDELGHLTRQTKNGALVALGTLERHHIIEWDAQAPMVAFPKYFRYNPIESAGQLGLVSRELPLLPSCDVKRRQIDRFVAHINTRLSKIRHAAKRLFPDLAIMTATTSSTPTRTRADARASDLDCSSDPHSSPHELTVEPNSAVVDPAATEHRPMSSDDYFKAFWKAYPRKQQQTKAAWAWNKLDPDTETALLILDAVKAWKRSKQWRSERGRYVPLAHNFLMNRVWEDEPGAPDNVAETNESEQEADPNKPTF